MKITAEPRSDQWNADDFVGGPRTFTIAGVKVGSAEQKYDIELVEGEGRVWRPPLTVLRLLIAAWGDDATRWVGHRVTLYLDPSIRFGPDRVGGIRVSHVSHIEKRLQVALTEKRGARKMHAVDPLPDVAPAPARAETLEERVAKMVAAFGVLDVTEAQIAWRIGAPRPEWSDGDLATLTAIYRAIQSGRSSSAEAFGGAEA